MRNHVSIENSPEYETAVEFKYPTEHLPEEIQSHIERYTDDIVKTKLAEAIRRLILLLEGEKNPQYVLQSLLCSVGINPLNGDGTHTNIAASLNISRQSFHYYTKTVGKRMATKIKRLQKDANNPFFS